MATYSYSAFHHIDSGADFDKTQDELLKKLYERLNQGGFKKAKFYTSSKWMKGGFFVYITTKQMKKAGLLDSLIPFSRPFRPSILVTVTWDRNLNSDKTIQEVSQWLQQEINN